MTHYCCFIDAKRSLTPKNWELPRLKKCRDLLSKPIVCQRLQKCDQIIYFLY